MDCCVSVVSSERGRAADPPMELVEVMAYHCYTHAYAHTQAYTRTHTLMHNIDYLQGRYIMKQLLLMKDCVELAGLLNEQHMNWVIYYDCTIRIF